MFDADYYDEDEEWVAEIERLAMLEAEALEYGDEDAGYDAAWDEV